MLRDYNWTFKCVFDLNWHLLTPQNYKKIKKGRTKARKGQVKNDYYTSMLHDHNWSFLFVFGLNWCQFTQENQQKCKKAAQRPEKTRKGQIKNDHYNSFMTLILLG